MKGELHGSNVVDRLSTWEELRLAKANLAEHQSEVCYEKDMAGKVRYEIVEPVELRADELEFLLTLSRPTLCH